VAQRTTPTFLCGTDAVVPFPVPVSWQAIALAGDRRLYMPCPGGAHAVEHREVRDAQLLSDALRSPIAEFRRTAIAAYGRLGRPDFVGMPGPLIRALDDGDPIVRGEAASAIADALAGVAVEPGDTGAHPATGEQVNFARAALEGHFAAEKNDDVAGMYLEALGRLKYADDDTRTAVEIVIAGWASGAPARLLGAVKGLESLTRANPRRVIQPATRDLLRILAQTGTTLEPVPTVAGRGTAEVPGERATLARVRRLAMQTLATARDDDVITIVRASRDADWQVRRFAAMRLNPGHEEMAEMRERLAIDPEFQVRYEVVGVEGRAAATTHECTRVLKALDDPSTMVVLRAIDAVPLGCNEAVEISAKLLSLVADLGRSGGASVVAGGRAFPAGNWHVPARALLAMQRLGMRDDVNRFLERATTHAAWQVRATVATIAGQQKDFVRLLRLAANPDANVRTAALEAIAGTKSDDIITAQIRALDSPDHQLVRTAANMLRGTPAARRDEASNALLNALTRLTKLGADTSRDPRVAILQRLQELLPVELGSRLIEFGDDVDPKVRAAAQMAYRTLIGATLPVGERTSRRYPVQPTDEQLAALPLRATIKLAGAMPIELELLVRDAPITVARFAELAKAGYYDQLTFHRVVPNFVVQGGSPGANEYVGVARYWRDEISAAPHTRGAVGISTRGRDSGDGQIFIDLVDVPRLDHDYTVFARVISGLDIVDKILEGARIESITVR